MPTGMGMDTRYNEQAFIGTILRVELYRVMIKLCSECNVALIKLILYIVSSLPYIKVYSECMQKPG